MLRVNHLTGFNRRRTGGGYRYYRVYVTAQNSGATIIAELELLKNSVDQIPTMTAATTSGVTMSADAEDTNREAWRAGDDNTANPNQWSTGIAATPHWIKVDFGSETVIDEYSIQSWSGGAQYYPVTWTFDGSNNDTDWDTLDSQSGQSFTAGEKKNFSL